MSTPITTDTIPGLGKVMITRLAHEGFTTLEDLADVGVSHCKFLDESDPRYIPGVRSVLDDLSSIGGLGPVRINAIRRALAAHGLELVDEYQASQSAWLKEK